MSKSASVSVSVSEAVSVSVPAPISLSLLCVYCVSSVPCGVCGGGHTGASRTCSCSTRPGRWVGVGELCMVVVRVVLGDCHVALDYDEVWACSKV